MHKANCLNLKKHSFSGCNSYKLKKLNRKTKTISQPESTRKETYYFLNSYHPLGETKAGRIICDKYNLQPYIDFSIRREPDFESKRPSISGLCRCNKLIKPAQKGDRIAYVTVKKAGKRRLVALLEVLEKCADHEKAKEWYGNQGIPLPSNCVVAGNPCLPLKVAVPSRGFTSYENWCNVYLERARNCPAFLICRYICQPRLNDPPILPEDIFKRPFPNTRSPKKISKSEFEQLRRLMV